MTNNTFLEVNKRKINNLIYHCESYRASGAYGGNLNLFDIIYTIKSLVQEVERLQKEIDSLQINLTILNEKKSAMENSDSKREA